MVAVSQHERAIGIDRYVSSTPGIGGQIKAAPEDFVVREQERFSTEPMAADPDAYPHLVIRATLRNQETNAFAQTLSDRLGISRERISWAGTKDKRAVTTQLFSVYDVDPETLPTITDADIEIVGRAGRAIRFGDLAGNAFEIVVRNIENPDHVDAITEELRAFGVEKVGVPNWFGQQRFGSYRPVTHTVGLAILRENWEEAVRTYVTETVETEPERTRRARQQAADHFAARDWQAALRALPERLGYERSLLHGYIEHDDFKQALEELPNQLQQLFVHAAQSYLFNRILSERLARGLPFNQPVEGDIVCFTEQADNELSIPDPDRTQQVTDRRIQAVTRHCKRERAFVTAPLVGTDTELATGEQGDIERSVLAAEEIEPGDFDLPGDWASSGTRRTILVQTDIDIQQDPCTFSFTLPKGAYATVLLREYLKVAPTELA